MGSISTRGSDSSSKDYVATLPASSKFMNSEIQPLALSIVVLADSGVFAGAKVVGQLVVGRQSRSTAVFISSTSSTFFCVGPFQGQQPIRLFRRAVGFCCLSPQDFHQLTGQAGPGMALDPCVLFSVVALLAGCLVSGLAVAWVRDCGCRRVLFIFGGGGWLLAGRACVMPFGLLCLGGGCARPRR